MVNPELLVAAAVQTSPSVGVVVATGLTIVFSILILLYLLISLEGVIFKAIDSRKNGAAPQQKQAPKAAPAPAANVAPAVEKGIPGEVVAAIAAAVAALEGGKYTVRSVTRAKQGRSAWGGAGVASYTEPF